MSFFGCKSVADLQNLIVLPSWELPKKLLAIVPLLLWRPHPYPLPKFKIGDLVADDWVDEFDKKSTDFGEVRGICYLPEEYFGYPANTWVYFIYWTHTTCEGSLGYPCFAGEPTRGDQLKQVKQF
jgi:hypothetical protein